MSLTFISAGAGSGKTYTLTQTLGTLLNEGSVRPGGVIATTFTKKAATELRERVRQYLLQQGEFSLANAMGQARIGTVNSVCGSLLERFAFEAGMPTRQQVIEESQSALLIREAIDTATNQVKVAELSEIAERLSIDDWSQAVGELLMQARANDIEPHLFLQMAEQNANDLLAHFPPPSRRDLNAEIQKELDRILPEFQLAAAESRVGKTGKALKVLLDFRRQLQQGTPSWANWIKLSRLDPEKSLQPLVEPLRQIAGTYASHRQLHVDIQNYLRHIFAVTGTALNRYQRRKQELGVVDFTDQEHLLLKLLDRPEVAAVLREELDLLLVDEFQDTSPIQLALFLKLSQLSRKTYWVGDIKQAIYGFRGSDTALMQAILGALPTIGEQVGGSSKAVLSGSWRSRPPLVQLVNEIFISAFSESLTPDEISLSPQRQEIQKTPALANWVLAETSIEKNAMALAAGVQQLLASGREIPDEKDQDSTATRPLKAQDIAILCATHAGIAAQTKALRQIGIPVATGHTGLLATPEATLALACLRRLNDPADTIATAEILSLADSSEPEFWLKDRLTYLAQGEPPHLWRETGEGAHPLLLKISALRDELPLLSPREALQRLIVICELPRCVLAWQESPTIARTRLANLEALLEMANQYEETCRGTRQAATLSGLLLWLEKKAEESEDRQAEPSLDAIRILTHHAAKGLEWPVVILCDLDKTVRNRLWGISAVSKGQVDAFSPLAKRFIRYWPWPFGKLSSDIPVLQAINQSPEAQSFTDAATAEAQRLLYVSMTRPRELLVLARTRKAKTEDWLDTLQASWLNPIDVDENSNCTSEHPLLLPSGTTVPAETWILERPEALSTQKEEAIPIHWFAPLPAMPHQSLYANPSAQHDSHAHVTEQINVGSRMAIRGTPDWGVLGSALHACIALSFTDIVRPVLLTEIERLLTLFQVREHLSPSEVLGQIHALHDWIASRWPNARPIAESPVRTRLPDGKILNGRIDLLLETQNGYVLIDHKSSPASSGQWDVLARTHGGQLAAYSEAIQIATGKTVTESWLFLPVAATSLKIS